VIRANAARALFGTGTPVGVGRYVLEREVGTGGGGAVFVARDAELDRAIAQGRARRPATRGQRAQRAPGARHVRRRRGNSAADDWPVFLTADGCLLYLASSRPGGLGGMDIWVAQRGP
jgi:hypothetical protein